jgi:hypothetical protein
VVVVVFSSTRVCAQGLLFARQALYQADPHSQVKIALQASYHGLNLKDTHVYILDIRLVNVVLFRERAFVNIIKLRILK